MVFSIFALVTTPVSSWRLCRAGAAAAGSLAIWFPQFALAKQCLDARKIFPRRAKLGHRFGLPRRKLKSQPKHLFSQFAHPLAQFRSSLITQLLDSPRH